MAGIPIQDQETANSFTAELTRGDKDAPPYTPFASAQLTDRPWMPSEPSFTRAHDTWGKVQTAHKRPAPQPLSFQTFVLYYQRFALAGDIAGAWGKFGGLAAQLAHLGTLLSIAATDTASTAIAYDKEIRVVIETDSRNRISEDQRGYVNRNVDGKTRRGQKTGPTRPGFTWTGWKTYQNGH